MSMLCGLRHMPIFRKAVHTNIHYRSLLQNIVSFIWLLSNKAYSCFTKITCLKHAKGNPPHTHTHTHTHEQHHLVYHLARTQMCAMCA